MACAKCSAHIADLEEQVAYWKSEAGALSEERFLANLRRTYKLTPQQAVLIEAMYRSHGRPLSRDQLVDRLRSDARNPEKLCDVLISLARDKLGYRAIETVWGVGYALTKKGLKLVDAAQEASAHEAA
jgi:DNA-binding response OmpR family regulator